MSGLNVGTLSALLDLDTNPFEKKLLGTETTADRAGKQMSQKLTLPLAAVAGAAGKLAGDFETAFARMVGLAGVPQSEVEGLKQSVLDLAGETAVAPQELADALYFAASAGLDAAGAMDAVTYAAKASAAGMGSAEQIVGLTASAVASYGAANIDAARATDILTAAVRAGRADPEELAGTLGRVLPVAAQLGVEFEEVGGAVAFLSNVFGDTNRTVTALSGFLVKLVSPTQQGRKALDEMGTSVEELQNAIDERGLMGALDLLRERGFAGNQQALRALFDDIEGYQAALALLNDESGSLVGTMEEVAGSTGALGEAFGAVADTDAHKAKQAWTDLQVTLTQLGDILLPVAADVAEFASTFLGWFDKLPGPVKTMVVVFGGLLAAMGPLVSVGSNVAKALRVLPKIYEDIALRSMYARDNIASLARTLGTGLAAIGTAAAAWQMYNSMLDESRSKGKGAVDALREQFAAIPESSMSMEKLRSIIAGMDGDLESLSDTIAGSQAPWDADKRAEMKAQREEGEKLRGEWQALEQQARDLSAEMGISEDAALRLIHTNADVAGAVDETTGEFDAQEAAVAGTTAALEDYADQIAAMFDPLFGMQDAAWKLKDAQDAVTAAVEANNDANADNNVSAEEMIRLNQDAVRAAADYEQALANLSAGIQDGTVDLEAAKAKLAEWVAQGKITQTQADEAAWSFGELGAKAEAVPDHVGITATADTSQASAALEALASQALDVAGRVAASVFSFQSPRRSATPTRNPDGARAAGGPVWPGRWLVGEDGPEVVDIDGVGRVHNADVSARMLSGGGSVAPASGGAPTVIDQSRSTFAPQITTGLDAAQVVAVLDRWTRRNYGAGAAEILRKAAAL